MSNELRVKRSNVTKVEQHLATRSLQKNHSSVNSSKILNTISDGERYIKGLKRVLKLNDIAGIDEFIDTLCFNIQFDGASATEFKQIEFKAFGKTGSATYILVATNVNTDQRVTVCYSYHAITETILENRVYSTAASDIFLDWLRAKSCESLQAMLPRDVAPQLIYE
ncbi:unnamed protein product [Rotaria magnacalcarata]|uniref:Uncharacterized protein n=1 Tax=Rotaria magnacalcarata TaxID=392030 RepID=A0A815ZZ78_9BILA|nr:unnamed protein product [Rotaria magnacalcarata]CAF1681325.1 unnamed protein product [Rotaria magnacalcarata]CAF4162493.1 unnamed protein product [Rotaria magnacalcarata]CAF4218571.1 unnamed protein product [Rotaria magnacalcarata]